MKPRALTELEQKALAFFQSFVEHTGGPPSVREVGAHLGLANPNNAKPVLDRLVALGKLSRGEVGVREPGRPRRYSAVLPRPRGLVYPYRGPASCGTGVEGAESDETIDLHDVLPGEDGLAAFTARGDSMIDAHIANGDLLLVEENPDPEEGTVVVALLDRDLVCKRLGKKCADQVRLDSCNGSLAPIELDPSRTHFRFLGVLKHVIRRV